MLQGYMKDSLNKAHGIRSGEPKRPESLIEMSGMVPEVPEVSLCFNQEKNTPFQSNSASNFEEAGNDLKYHNQGHKHNEMLYRNKYESYNSWKAKNAEVLHNITAGLERVDPRSKCATITKKSAGIVRKQSSGKESYSSSLTAVKYPVNTAPELTVTSTQQNHSSNEYSTQTNENNAKKQISVSNQPSNNCLVEHHNAGFPVYKHHFPHHTRDSQGTEEIFKQTPNPSHISHRCKDKKNAYNTPYTFHMSEKSIPHGAVVYDGAPGFCVPNFCNKHQCSCEKQNVLENPLNGNPNIVNEKHPSVKELRPNEVQFVDTTKLFSPTDAGLISSHLSSLSHIVNIQKEQISWICQEISSQKLLMSALLEEVKKIHATISPNMQSNPGSSQTKTTTSCHRCACQHNNQDISNDNSEKLKSQINHNGNSAIKNTQTSSDNIEMRSVGVMTSSLENPVNQTVPSNDKDKSQVFKGNIMKSKKQHQKPKANSPFPIKTKQTNKNESTQIEENRKSHSNQSRRRKNNREESNESSQSDDSLSLDEAAVVTCPETGQGNFSPDVSIHVNMPDYSASSTESDTSDSSESEDEGQESGSEGESSDPQIGWTFYDRVVGQVNNMLKKTSNDPHQEQAHTHRKNPGNLFYQCNGDYDTENNWSKRVTFNGPPLEESDNNGMHMPRYNQFRANQDYKMNGGPDRMQDYLICDYANAGNNLSLVNGSTNVSFATYRYYQRHQLLPQPPSTKVLEQYLNPPKVKKKSKTRKSEKIPQVFLKSHKRRSGGPPSKILDVSALKHQPKLF